MISIRSIVREEDQICCYRSVSSTGPRALWEIVRACNLRCAFCLVPDGTRGLPLEQTERIAHELIAAGINKVMLSGGEPLLYRPLPRIIAILLEAGTLVKLLTNGTVHRPEVLDLVRANPAMEVSLSLESARPEVNDAIFRRSGSHARILRTLESLPPERVHLNVVCSRSNRGEIADLLDQAAIWGVGSVSLINVFQNPAHAGRFEEDCTVHRLTTAERTELLAVVERKRDELRDRLVIRTLNFRSAGHESCAAGRSIVYVTADGDILPCTLTDNTGWAERTRGLTVAQAMARFASELPSLPPSSCAAALRGVP